VKTSHYRGLRALASESAVYGVVLVSGMVALVTDTNHASGEVLLKIISTVLVFWAAHVYAGVVAYPHDQASASGVTWAAALRASISHSWGMLVAALIPAAVLLLGVLGVLNDGDAIWASLWVDVALLALIGYFGVATWSTKLWARLAGGLVTAVLGLVLIALKVLIH
jgi:hypothetical protein